MKKVFLILVVMLAIGITGYTVEDDVNCPTVKDRTIPYLAPWYLGIAGESMSPGFDVFGYNYQAHLFNGYYPNHYYNKLGLPPYEGDEGAYTARLIKEGLHEKWLTTPYAQTLWNSRDVILVMKWNDAWLSNKDCDADGALDRHLGYDTAIGSGAWETNHQSGTCIIEGKEHHWTYFVKIAAVPANAVKGDHIYNPETGKLIDWTWYTADGTEIGPQIWTSYAIIQQVDNDPCIPHHGISYKSPAGPGFGKW